MQHEGMGSPDGGKARSRGKRRRKWLKEIPWIVGLIVVVLIGGRLMGALRAPDLVGQDLDFSLSDFQGQTVRLSDFRGQKVVLNVWATWCLPCRVELPALARFARKNPEIQVLGLSVQSPPKDLAEVAADLPYPTLIMDDETGLELGVNALPSTFVIDEQGRVTSAHSGLLFGPQLWWMTR